MYNDRFKDPKIIIIFQKLSWSNNLLLVNNYSRKERFSRNDRKNIVVTVANAARKFRFETGFQVEVQETFNLFTSTIPIISLQ